MILTQCAVCATELGLSLGKKCGRCSTRYCGPECQVQHWKEGGHDKLCKPIKKAGGAEQYNANKKYAEAVTDAAEACAAKWEETLARLHADFHGITSRVKAHAPCFPASLSPPVPEPATHLRPRG